MKNALIYYYNINVSSIHQKNDVYYFNVENNNYIFLKYDYNDELDDIYRLNKFLYQSNPCFYQIILNKNNEILTFIDNITYILLKFGEHSNSVSLNEIIKLNNTVMPLNKPKRDNWNKLWCDKVDYFEYQITQIGKKYPIIRESFNYYLGLSEMAIALYNNTPKDNLYLSLSHKRIIDLYNPLNIIVDFRVRDVCEYFKTKFFSSVNIDEELNLFLTNNNLTNNEKNLFISRMLFPTYYFDLYELIIEGKEDEICKKKIIVKANEYEKILKKIYFHFKINNNLYIEWFENFNLY